jgi:hypothetical protein
MKLSQKRQEKGKKSMKPEELVVLWTSGDREVALKMVFMYIFNSARFKWGWNHVTLIVWGPSAKLLTVDLELQEYLHKMQEVGVNVFACKKCSDLYGVTKDLKALGIDVKYMGKLLTQYLREDNYSVLSI